MPFPIDRNTLASTISDGGDVQDVNFFGRKGMASLGIRDKLIKEANRLLIERGGQASEEARSSVLKDTGLYTQRGIRGEAPALQWKMEGPTFQARLHGDAPSLDANSGSISRPLSEVLDYEKLYSAYPDLANLQATLNILRPGGRQAEGGYRQFLDPGNPAMKRPYRNYDDPIYAAGDTQESLRDTLLHEIQHAIQMREGFPQGYTSKGDPYAAIAAQRFDEMNAIAKQKLDEVNRLRPSEDSPELMAWLMDPEIQRLTGGYGAVANPNPASGKSYMGYRLSAGEQEADNAAARANDLITRQQQLENPPWRTQQYPEAVTWRERFGG